MSVVAPILEPLLLGPGSGGGGVPLPAPYRVYPARHQQLGVLFALILANAVLWVAFAAITPQVQAFFGDLPSLAVDAVALSFQLLFLPGTLLSYRLSDRKGLRTTLLTGGVLTTATAALRLGAVLLVSVGHVSARGAFIGLFLGTTLAALAQPLVLNVPAQLASAWFPVSQRDLVTSVGFMASPVGNALGVAVAPLLVTQSETDSSKVHGMVTFMVAQLVLATAATVWAWAVLKDRPPTPPSHAAALEEAAAAVAKRRRRAGSAAVVALGQQQRHRGWRASWAAVVDGVRAGWAPVRACWHSGRDFRVLGWCFGIGCGFFNAWMTVLGQLLAPCGYGSGAAGLVGGLLLLFGLLGAVAAGVILDRTHRYRLLLRVAFGGTVAGVVAVLALLHSAQHHWPIPLAIAFSVLGLVMLPLLPITMEAAAEATFPTPELVSSGVLLTAANLLGIPLVLLLSWLLDEDTCGQFLRPPVVVILVVVAAAALPLVLYKGETKRLEAEAQVEAEAEAIRASERDGSIF